MWLKLTWTGFMFHMLKSYTFKSCVQSAAMKSIAMEYMNNIILKKFFWLIVLQVTVHKCVWGSFKNVSRCHCNPRRTEWELKVLHLLLWYKLMYRADVCVCVCVCCCCSVRWPYTPWCKVSYRLCSDQINEPSFFRMKMSTWSMVIYKIIFIVRF